MYMYLYVNYGKCGFEVFSFLIFYVYTIMIEVLIMCIVYV